jgi:hypothetical protein
MPSKVSSFGREGVAYIKKRLLASKFLYLGGGPFRLEGVVVLALKILQLSTVGMEPFTNRQSSDAD